MCHHSLDVSGHPLLIAIHPLAIVLFVTVLGFRFVIAPVACTVFFSRVVFESFISISLTSMGQTSRCSGCKLLRSEHSFGKPGKKLFRADARRV